MVAIDDLTEVPEELFISLLKGAQEMEERGVHREYVDEKGRRGLVRSDVYLEHLALEAAEETESI